MASWCFVFVLLSLRTASGKQSEGATFPMRESAQRTATVIVNARGESSVAVQEQQDYEDYSYYSSALSSTDSYYGLGSSDEYDSYYGLGSSDEYYYSYELGSWVGDKITAAEHLAGVVATAVEHPEKLAKYEGCTEFLKVASKKTVGTFVKKALTKKAVGTIATEGTCVEADLDIAALCAAANFEDGEILGVPCAAGVGTLWTALCNKIVTYGTTKFLQDLSSLTDGKLTTATACASLGYKKP